MMYRCQKGNFRITDDIGVKGQIYLNLALQLVKRTPLLFFDDVHIKLNDCLRCIEHFALLVLP